jgi:hypothetical protein
MPFRLLKWLGLLGHNKMALFINTIARRPYTRFFVPKTDVDLVDDFGGVWEAWNTYHRAAGRLCTLNVPAGTYALTGSTTDWARNHPGATIQGAGSALTTITGPGTGWRVGAFAGVRGNGLSYNNNGETVEPRIQTASAGATQVTLINPSKSFCFHPGRAVMIVGFDMQGFGQPINNAVLEFNRVVSVDGVTGVIVLEQPLANDYKSTWPVFNTGNTFEPDPMGSAGIIAMTIDWDAEYTMRDITVDADVGGLIQGGSGRAILFENCIFATDQTIPSVNESFIMRGCELRGFVEIDKMVDLVWYDDCISTGFVQNQSSSIKFLKITDSQFTELQGTAAETELADSTFGELSLGPSAYGAGGAVTMDNVVVTSDLTAFGRNAEYNASDWTFDTAAGTLTMPSTTAKGSNALISLVPNAYLMPQAEISSSAPCGPVFKVTDCAEVGSNFVYTIEGLPDPCPHILDLPWDRIMVHPCPDLTVTNTDSGAYKECSTANGAGRPWGAYSYKHSDDVTFTASGTFISGLTPSTERVGYLEEIRVNVITPYTGTLGTLTLTPLRGTSGTFSTVVHEDGTWDATTLRIVINLKTAGERVLTSGSVTGAQAGDTISGWTGDREFLTHTGDPSTSLSANISGESPSVWPVFEVEIILNHDLWP